MPLTSQELFVQSGQHALQESPGWVGKNLNRQNVTLIPAKHADKAFVHSQFSDNRLMASLCKLLS